MSEYQGFSNRATWRVALEIDNDFELLNHTLEMACEMPIEELPDSLRDEHFRMTEAAEPYFQDLALIALESVNWKELANHYLGKLKTSQ